MADNSGKAGKKRRGAGRPFQPGVSGNPGGRPAEIARVRKLAGEHGEEAVQVLVELMLNKREKGTVRAIAANSILDRWVGKPVQAITGADGGPLEVNLAASVDLNKLTLAELQQLAALRDKAKP